LKECKEKQKQIKYLKITRSEKYHAWLGTLNKILQN